jgi:hypothetical protein
MVVGGFISPCVHQLIPSEHEHPTLETETRNEKWSVDENLQSSGYAHGVCAEDFDQPIAGHWSGQLGCL